MGPWTHARKPVDADQVENRLMPIHRKSADADPSKTG
jgi:hypothetical protein